MNNMSTPDFDTTLFDASWSLGATSSAISPPVVSLPRPRVHASALASSIALLYPTVDATLQTVFITIVVFLHNVILLSLAYVCMKANKRFLIMGLFIWLALFPWVLDEQFYHTNVEERFHLRKFLVTERNAKRNCFVGVDFESI